MIDATDKALAFDTAVNAAKVVRVAAIKDCLSAVNEAERAAKSEQGGWLAEEDSMAFDEVRLRISGLLPAPQWKELPHADE